MTTVPQTAIEQKQLGEDPRFTAGLLFDVEAVLERHGYPALKGDEHTRLQLALFRFLYPRPPEGSR